MIILRDSKLKVYNAQNAASILQTWLKEQDEIDRDKEYGIVIVLNVKQRVLLVEVVSVGTLDATIAHPREIFRRAISVGGASIIYAHNHPSLECDPSPEDIECTKRMQKAGSIIGICLQDSIVFSPDNYYSLAEHGYV